MSQAVVQPPSVQIVEPDDGFTLRLARKPEAIIAEARLCANALLGAVRNNNWAQKFGNKEHLFFEAWSFLATMYRVTPRVRETRLVQIGDVTGYEAFGEAFHVPSGIVISTADSMCLDDEDNWDMRPVYEYDRQANKRVKVGESPVPLFQLRSMAQTRAMAKALRGPFSWIVAMAGYAPRAAEEMQNGDTAPSFDAEGNVQQPQRKATPSNGSTDGRPLITEKQASRIWALGHQASKSKDDIVAILKHFGFATAKDVTTDKYEALCAEVLKGDAQ
jgi:hypothetical protein